MRSLIEFLKGIFSVNNKEIIKSFWKQELNELYREKLIAIECLREIDKKINKTELVIFGN